MRRFLVLIVLAGAVSEPLQAADTPDKVDYVRDIKPIFARYCTTCHGAKEQESGLRLDFAARILEGGDSGPAVVPGKAGESLLIDAVTTGELVERMPLEGPPLPAEKIALLKKWINEGARAPKEVAGVDPRRKHWSFQRPQRPPLPTVKNLNWPRTPIDYFVLAKLEKQDWSPSDQASRRILLRRVTLDLLGIPPSVEEIDQFLRDDRPGAYERLVDRLLASPHYGERWGRHWLDVARYADSNGYTRDFGREIWKYRDWVINAVNHDVPFDQFTIEQFAGDMLPGATLQQKVATGFHRNTLINEEGGTDKEQFRVDAVADRVNTTGVAFLGLTLGCARCHEHKYDPISQREYYEIFAFLNNCDEPKIDAPSNWQIKRGDLRVRAEIRKQVTELEKRLSEMEDRVLKQQLAWEKTITPEQRSKLPGPLQAALDKSLEERDDAQKKLVRDHYKKTDAARKAFPIVEEIAQLRSSEPKIPTTMVMSERKKPRETFIHRRGNFLDNGRRVTARVPGVLHPLPADAKNPSRLDFARWLVADENPLTPRVTMNRHWQHFFGRGLVETENDFGLQGTPPTHPQLLDWLAVEFVEQDWSVKEMHRLIVTSAVYRQSSRLTPEAVERDPYNKLLARQSRFRLDAEVIRDSALAAAGLLTNKIGGPSVHPPQPDGVFDFTQDPKPWTTDTGEDRYRRAMYTHLWRSSPYPFLMTFDFPEANTTCTRRVRSNTPLAALALLNDTLFVECARALGRIVLNEPTDADRADLIARRTITRRFTDEEHGLLQQVIDEFRTNYMANQDAARELVGGDLPKKDAVELAVWILAARIALNLDEFITRE